MKRRAPVQGCSRASPQRWMSCHPHQDAAGVGGSKAPGRQCPWADVQIRGNDKSAAASGRVASGTPGRASTISASHPDRQPCQQRPHITELDEGMEEQPGGHSTSSGNLSCVMNDKSRQSDDIKFSSTAKEEGTKEETGGRQKRSRRARSEHPS